MAFAYLIAYNLSYCILTRSYSQGIIFNQKKDKNKKRGKRGLYGVDTRNSNKSTAFKGHIHLSQYSTNAELAVDLQAQHTTTGPLSICQPGPLLRRPWIEHTKLRSYPRSCHAWSGTTGDHKRDHERPGGSGTWVLHPASAMMMNLVVVAQRQEVIVWAS